MGLITPKDKHTHKNNTKHAHTRQKKTRGTHNFFFFFSQVDELDVEALDLLEHLILGKDLLQREGLLVEDVVDGTAGFDTELIDSSIGYRLID